MKVLKLGGLGSPHMGSPEWENKMQSYKRMKDYGNACNIINKRMLED